MKPTYEELINRVSELEIEAENCRIAEKSLRRSNDIVNSILSAAPIGIGLVENRFIKQINGGMLKMFRFDSEMDYLRKERPDHLSIRGRLPECRRIYF
jgi:hypothetical protein